MTALRLSCDEMPSNPKPNSSESAVLMVAPTGNPEASVRTRLLAFSPLVSGCPTVQPPPGRRS
jgi:hypothetical protein